MDYLLLFTTHMPAILLVEDPGGAGLPWRITVPSELQKVWWRQGPMIRGKYFLLLPQKNPLT
jgi:hypothetical protein